MNDRSKSDCEIIPYKSLGNKVRVATYDNDYENLSNEIRNLYVNEPDKKICILARGKKNFDEIKNAITAVNIPVKIYSNDPQDLSMEYSIFKNLILLNNDCNPKMCLDNLAEITGNSTNLIQLSEILNGNEVSTKYDCENYFKVSNLKRLYESINGKTSYAENFHAVISNYCKEYYKCINRAEQDEYDYTLSCFLKESYDNDWPYPNKENVKAILNKFENKFKKGECSIDDDDEKYVLISSIHSAKGLEYDTVFITSMDSRSFPNTFMIEEKHKEKKRELETLKNSESHLRILRDTINENYIESLIRSCKKCKPKTEETRERLNLMCNNIEQTSDDLIGLKPRGINDYRSHFQELIKPTIDYYEEKIREKRKEIDSCNDEYLSRRHSKKDDFTITMNGEQMPLSEWVKRLEKEIENISSEKRIYEKEIAPLINFDKTCMKAESYLSDMKLIREIDTLLKDLEKKKYETINEEKRLFYVAVSRARDNLYLCYSNNDKTLPSSFIDYISKDNKENYFMKTRSQEKTLEKIKQNKRITSQEVKNKRPNLNRVDAACNEIVDVVKKDTDMKAQLEESYNSFMSKNTILKNLPEESKKYLLRAVYLKTIEGLLNIDFKAESILDLQRAGEHLLIDYIGVNATMIKLDNKHLCEATKDIRELIKKECKIKSPPNHDYFTKLLLCETPGILSTRYFKEMIIEAYVMYSGKYIVPALTKNTWPKRDMKNPDSLVIFGMDLANYRNEATHNNKDEAWKSEALQCSIDCLKELTDVMKK